MATATIAATSAPAFTSQLSSCNTTAVRALSVSNGARVFAATQKKGTAVRKAAPKPPGRPLWYPGAKAPAWLDGSLPGDRGFDPLGLSKPAEYLQIELDGLDQNLAKNLAGDVIGTRISKKDTVSPTAFQPYAEVFSLTRFRENEVIHGRWAMLGVLGAIAVEAFTGVAWQDAGKVELDNGASYFGLPLPFSISALVYIEVLVIGYIEFQRNAELDPEKRVYPGGKYFDPLGLATPASLDNLKLAEIKHGRLAMISALGYAVQAAVTGEGPLANLGI
eukprot:TRINITY_DN3903_c0_g1_i1.p2 TRINITY_DN3903_c0_g1~~TRINITY_DN3903_c0_g1_i1.p2  ORF type:complete len:277 (+),score=60.06 TRINITY_DN3903_c0_g1_i1:173-1003(+)